MKYSTNAKYEKIPQLHSNKHLEAESGTRTPDSVSLAFVLIILNMKYYVSML